MNMFGQHQPRTAPRPAARRDTRIGTLDTSASGVHGDSMVPLHAAALLRATPLGRRDGRPWAGPASVGDVRPANRAGQAFEDVSVTTPALPRTN